MGKNLLGKELGRGITQRKDGKYEARFVSSNTGKRIGEYFSNLKQAKEWLEQRRYEDKFGTAKSTYDFMTVDSWFNYWVENIIFDLAPNTIRNYNNRYKINIQPIIGKMNIHNVKPMHCKSVLKKMHEKYAGSTIKQTYITMGTMFKAAVMNDIIEKHPMNGVRYTKPMKSSDNIRFLSVEEQKLFLQTARRSHNYFAYALILETGLRTGELIALTFDCIDWQNHTLTINKTLEYRHGDRFWRAGPPKTDSSYRTIPLTKRAYTILNELFQEKKTRKESPELATKLEYLDRKSGTMRLLNMQNLVFVNFRTGMPNKNSSYDTHLYKLCDEAGLRHFSMHALRHTYATRAIEYGINPKVLMQLLGHSSIKTTMDKYVHNTAESLENGIKLFEFHSGVA